jgi:hypothetical protein
MITRVYGYSEAIGVQGTHLGATASELEVLMECRRNEIHRARVAKGTQFFHFTPTVFCPKISCEGKKRKCRPLRKL